MYSPLNSYSRKVMRMKMAVMALIVSALLGCAHPQPPADVVAELASLQRDQQVTIASVSADRSEIIFLGSSAI
jgi:hypothetical protein